MSLSNHNTLMAAHRALSVADVLNEIFEWYDTSLFSWVFYPGDYSNKEPERIRMLASAACVSWSFHEAAVRVLWRNLDSLYPIFNLLPSLQKVEDHPNDYTDLSYAVYSLPEHVPEHEWEHMLKYTAHVRAIRLWDNMYTSRRLSPESWSTIRRFGERRQIVPNLFSLRWIVDLAEPTAMLLFLAPSVEMVTIICDATATDPDAETRARWASCLERLTKECCERNPRLTDLSFELRHISPSSVMPHLKPLNSLIEFTTASDGGRADIAHLHTLAATPTLESLTFPSLTGSPDSRLADPSYGFRNLQSLHLRRCSGVAEVFASASLVELSIDCYTYRDASLLHQSCAAWARAFPTLRDFGIYINAEVSEDVAPRPALASVIAPLLALRSLRSVSFAYSTYVPFSVADADLAALSGAWPSLVSLSISEVVFGRDFPSCSVGVLGFLALARNCPDLEHFSLTRVVLRPEDVAALPPDSLDHRLRSLYVGHGLTEDAYRVITDKIFPHLENKPELDTSDDVVVE